MCNKHKAPVTWPFVLFIFILLGGVSGLAYTANQNINERDQACAAKGGEIAKVFIKKRQELRCIKRVELLD